MTESLDVRQTGARIAEMQKDPDKDLRRGGMVAEVRRALPCVFARQPVSLAYLFGSMTTGRSHPFSDVDLALVVDQGLTPLDRLKLILRIQLNLDDGYGISNADVRIINDAPLVFQGRVLRDGILVYARAEEERVAFETRTRLRYFDYLPVHERLQEAFFAELRERGLYG